MNIMKPSIQEFHFKVWCELFTHYQHQPSCEFSEVRMASVQQRVTALGATGFSWTKESMVGMVLRIGDPLNSPKSMGIIHEILTANVTTSVIA